MTEQDFSYPYMVFGEATILKSKFNEMLDKVLEANAGSTVIAFDIAKQVCDSGLTEHDIPPKKFASIVGKVLMKKGFKTGLSTHGRYYLIPKEFVSRK